MKTQKTVSGTVRLKLYKSGLYTAGRKSKLSLYNPDIATMEADPTDAYNQDDATGFINLNALRLKVRAKVQGVKTRVKKELTFGGQFHLRVNVGDACRAGGISDSTTSPNGAFSSGLNIQVYLRVCFLTRSRRRVLNSKSVTVRLFKRRCGASVLFESLGAHRSP